MGPSFHCPVDRQPFMKRGSEEKAKKSVGFRAVRTQAGLYVGGARGWPERPCKGLAGRSQRGP